MVSSSLFCDSDSKQIERNFWNKLLNYIAKKAITAYIDLFCYAIASAGS